MLRLQDFALVIYKSESLANMNTKHLPVYGSVFVAAAFLMLLNIGVAAGQGMPGMTEVSGTYTNEARGVTVQFPEGWSGFEMTTDMAVIVTTAPGGMMSSAPTNILSFMVADKTEVQDPTDPESFSQDSSTDCTDPTVSSTQISGKTGYLVVAECTNADGSVWKFKTASIQTADSWVTLAYMAVSSDFAANESAFDSALASVQVDGATDVDLTGVQTGGSGGGSTTIDVGIELRAITQAVSIAGENVNVDLRTNSTISAFALDEENKRVTFTVDGGTGTDGTTEISIGRVLEGPYTVTIDGQATTNVQESTSASGEAMLTISYTHSTHDVAVTGTNVVPEFPIAAIAAIAAVIGVVAVVGRTSLFRPKL
jgi:hypothetical protein